MVTPHFYINSPFSIKTFRTPPPLPSDSIFGTSYPPLIRRWGVPTIKSHQQNEKTKKVTHKKVPPSPLNKSKCKNFIQLQKIEELLVSTVIIIKMLIDFYFQKLLNSPRKVQTINAQCNNT